MSEVERRADERYISIIAALREIADDETANPKRRKIARDALAADARRGPQTSLFMEYGLHNLLTCPTRVEGPRCG